jgi:hypothetical protein
MEFNWSFWEFRKRLEPDEIWCGNSKAESDWSYLERYCPDVFVR